MTKLIKLSEIREEWLPENDQFRRNIGIFGRFAGEPGSGRFGIANMSNAELVENFKLLKNDDRRLETSEAGAKLAEIYDEILLEIEQRYLKRLGMPSKFIRIINAQGGIDWGDFDEEIYEEMGDTIAGNQSRRQIDHA